MAQKAQKPIALHAALLGLVGTLLTACSGLTGAIISAAVTVYRVEREMQQVKIAPPDSDQPLVVDTRQIAISYTDAMKLSPDTYYISPDLGFVLAQPGPGWNPVEETTYRELFQERGTWTGSAWDEQPVRRIHYREPVDVQFQQGAELNGIPVDVETFRRLYGTDTVRFSTEITVLTVPKEKAANLPSLAAIALHWGSMTWAGANRIVADREGTYVLIQTSWRAQNVRVEGQEGHFSVDRWALFAEGPKHYYVVETVYAPRTDDSVQVWEDLQAYIRSFRVIR